LPSTPSSPDAGAGDLDRDREPRVTRRALAALVVLSVVVPLGLLAAILLANRDDGSSRTIAPAADCRNTDEGASTTTTPTTAATPSRADVGAPAPDFTLLTLDRCTVEQLSAHRGIPVVLTFFASWCHPCEQEMPLLQAAHEERPEAFDVLAVTYDDFRSDAAHFAQRLGVTYPTLYDTDGIVAGHYGISAIPQTWFIDADGVVRRRVYGITSRDALDEPLNALLG
jgi:cytochrome c biogenesis protein CcmG, thiol:disulfide interchange protein DsbE